MRGNFSSGGGWSGPWSGAKPVSYDEVRRFVHRGRRGIDGATSQSDAAEAMLVKRVLFCSLDSGHGEPRGSSESDGLLCPLMRRAMLRLFPCLARALIQHRRRAGERRRERQG
jgi:hypothetical protein